MPVRRVLLGFPAKRWMQMRRRWRALGRAHLARRLRSPEGARAVAVGGEPPPSPPCRAGLPLLFHWRCRTQLPKAGTEVMSGRRYETCHFVIASSQ